MTDKDNVTYQYLLAPPALKKEAEILRQLFISAHDNDEGVSHFLCGYLDDRFEEHQYPNLRIAIQNALGDFYKSYSGSLCYNMNPDIYTPYPDNAEFNLNQKYRVSLKVARRVKWLTRITEGFVDCSIHGGGHDLIPYPTSI